jgi:myo-inositol catabolism protein IolC
MDNRPTAHDPLLIMAMDHRASFGKTLFGVVDDRPTDAQVAAMERAKQVIYAGLRAVVDVGGQPAVLVDERYGHAVVDEAQRDGVVLAVPVERSGQDWFGYEWGDQWRDHLNRVRPDFAKILVRDNPAFNAADRKAQFAALRELSEELHKLEIPLLYELLVPGTAAQLDSVGQDKDRYDADVRPTLEVQVIAENQQAGVEPSIWKIEGLETADAASAVVAQIRAGGRSDVDAILLGRDAPRDRLLHWIDIAAPIDGFVGFAIGRSIWEDAIAALTEGKVDEAGATSLIAEEYASYARHYVAAANR